MAIGNTNFKARRIKLLAGILLLTLFSSCSYHWETIIGTDGIKYFYKDYKNYNVNESMRRREIFKDNNNPKIIPKYAGTISWDTVCRSTYIQFDTDRIYLFSTANDYKEIFTLGLLSAQKIYCMIDNNCTPVPYPEARITDLAGKAIVQDYYGWTGHTIIIGYIALLTNVKSNGIQRRFEIWDCFGDVFFLELTNAIASKNTNFSDFAKNAKVTLFKKGWTII